MGIALPETGWLSPLVARVITILGVVAIAIGIALTIRHEQKLRTQDAITTTEPYAQIWEHYTKLVDLILSLENASRNDMPTIRADIQKELSEMSDSKIDEIMTQFLDAVEEVERFGTNPIPSVIRLALERTRQYMNRKYKRH